MIILSLPRFPSVSAALSGKWKRLSKKEYIVSDNPDSKISVNFEATRVYLVMSAEEKSLITVFLDGKTASLIFLYG